MKSKILLLTILLVLPGLRLQSQYFYGTYGSPATDAKCMSAVSMDPGFLGLGTLMAGVNGTKLIITHTDAFGVVVCNQEHFFGNLANTPMTLTSAQIAESNMAEIVVIGTFIEPASLVEGVFFARFDAMCNLIAVNFFNWAIPLTALRLDGLYGSGTGQFYVAGQAYYNGAVGFPGTYPIALAFNSAGVNQWARVYTMGSVAGMVVQAADIEFYAPNNTLYMAGMYRTSNVAESDAFVLNLNAGTGAWIAGWRYGVTGLNRNDSFSGITTCNSTKLGGVTGLIVCGATNSMNGVHYDGWGLKINATGGILTTRVYDYAPIANQNNFFNDVMERVTQLAAPTYTYFFTGWVIGGAIGLDDAHVVKTNEVLGMPNHYTYGTVGLNEQGEFIAKQDPSLGAGGNGMYVFSTSHTAPGNRDFMLVGAYYNGVTHTGCPEVQAVTNSPVGPPLLADLYAQELDSLIPTSGVDLPPYSVAANIICPDSGAVPGGSNGKMFSEAQLAAEMIRIEAASGVRNLSAISIHSTNSGMANVTVTAITGQILFRAEMKLEEGANSLPTTGDIPAGIVIVSVTTQQGNSIVRKVLLQ